MKKIIKILLPLVMICAQLASCSNSEEVLRGVSMGMTSSQVYAVEGKREEKGKAVAAYNARLYFDVTVFNLPCQYITYFFGVEDALNKIYCVFDDATGENYDSLVEVLTDLLDQDLTSYEYFHSLPREIQQKIIREDIGSFEEMQDFVAGLR